MPKLAEKAKYLLKKSVLYAIMYKVFSIPQLRI